MRATTIVLAVTAVLGLAPAAGADHRPCRPSRTGAEDVHTQSPSGHFLYADADPSGRGYVGTSSADDWVYVEVKADASAGLAYLHWEYGPISGAEGGAGLRDGVPTTGC